MDVSSCVIALCSLWALGSFVDRVDEMPWIVVLSEGFIEVTEFTFFFCLGCPTMCVYVIEECFKAAGFV